VILAVALHSEFQPLDPDRLFYARGSDYSDSTKCLASTVPISTVVTNVRPLAFLVLRTW
jgi:hypothetical protein